METGEVKAFLDSARASYLAAGRLAPEAWRGQVLEDSDLALIGQGIVAGLVSLEEDGLLLTTRFDRPASYRVFLTYDGGTARPGPAVTWSWQEAFPQIAYAVELVLEHGWGPEEVALEVDRLDVGVGTSPRFSPRLLAEAKVTDLGPSGLAAMLAVFDELSGGPAASVAQGVRANAVPKYEGLLRLKPDVLVAVAPGVRYGFDLTYEEGRVHLRRRDLPVARSLLTNR